MRLIRCRGFIAILLGITVARLTYAAPATQPTTQPATGSRLFARENLVAWCIVPFDAKRRSPEERAAMLQRIGIKRFAYDWRNEHLPTFERELAALEQQHIELTAVWFPGPLDENGRFILTTLEKHKLTPQLWVMIEADNVDAAANAIRPIATEGDRIGCKVGLYNHGGWFGEPENQIAIIDKLNLPNVGIVYNLHHGHEHLDRFETILPRIKPHLLCLNLNGMAAGGEKVGKKILPIGEGDLDRRVLRTIRDSGYGGPIGILNHTDEDAEGRLLDNIEGLEWLVPQLTGAAPTGPRPPMRTYRAATQPTTSSSAYWSVEDAAAREALPLYETTPAATLAELTPANGWPDARVYADWSRSHGNDASTRYALLTQINRENVKSLKQAWVYHSRDGAGNVQCNPVVVKGVMYAPTSGKNIVAVNAATGDELWRFNPHSGSNPPAYRGLTYYGGDESNGVSPRLLFASPDVLWALDPKTGLPIESFGERGGVRTPDCVVAPVVYRDAIIYAGWNGDVYAVDVRTGSPRWTFHTVPRPGEPFAQPDAPLKGANCWGGMALDASRGIVFVTLGSPKPNFIGVTHPGDDLFGNCVLALDATSGKRLWHFQEIRHDIWDLDIPAPPVLVTVNATRDGKTIVVDAVAAVTKIGNTLLVDRVSGKLLFPFRRKRAPVSNLPGERTAAYQPDVELPEPFAHQSFGLDDVTNISPKAHKAVLTQLQEVGATFGWFRPFTQGRPNVYYGLHGGGEWTGACFDPATGMLYVSSNEISWMPSVHARMSPAVDETKLPKTAGRVAYETSCIKCHGSNREGLFVNPSLIELSARMKDADVRALLKTGRGSMPAATYLSDSQTNDLIAYLFDRDRPAGSTLARPERPAYRDNGYPRLLDDQNYPGNKPPWGLLNAIDLNTGKIAWRVPLGEHQELTKRGITGTGTENFGGPLVTAGGLVFCAGTRDLKIRAFDKSTGEELWSAPLPFGGFAPPATYQVNGKQYVVIPATGGGKLAVSPYPPGPSPQAGDAYVAFAIP